MSRFSEREATEHVIFLAFVEQDWLDMLRVAENDVGGVELKAYILLLMHRQVFLLGAFFTGLTCPFRISWSACPDPSGRLIPTLLACLLYFKHKSNQFKKPSSSQTFPCADDHQCELVHLFHLSGGILQILERSVHA